jgi:hypothetical protein
MLASVLILAAGDFPFDGKVVPGEVPAAGLTRLAAVAKAFVRPSEFVELAPTFPPVERNGARAHAAATVVASLMTICVDDEISLQAPIAVISAIAELAEPAPILPPRATAYTNEADEGHVYDAGTVKAPDESVVSVAVSSAVAADPLPVVPAA